MPDHLQLGLHRPLSPVLLGPALVVAGVRLNHRVDHQVAAGAARILSGQLVSLSSRSHAVVRKVPKSLSTQKCDSIMKILWNVEQFAVHNRTFKCSYQDNFTSSFPSPGLTTLKV